MIREIVKIDEEKCTGCSECVPNCHEGALQIIDNKAVLISDLLCDGLGACLGHCPEGAITIEKREAEPYDEIRVMSEMVKKGKNVVFEHLRHLRDHNEMEYFNQGKEFLMAQSNKIEFVNEVMEKLSPVTKSTSANATFHTHSGSCPGSRSMEFTPAGNFQQNKSDIKSALTHWPIQLHLINPGAAHFQKCDLVVAADCTAFTFANFHSDYLNGKKLVIACPKLDTNKEIYIEKIITLIEHSKVNTITAIIMEVPCCGGLFQMIQTALHHSSRKIPLKRVIVGIQGDILSEDWM